MYLVDEYGINIRITESVMRKIFIHILTIFIIILLNIDMLKGWKIINLVVTIIG